MKLILTYETEDEAPPLSSEYVKEAREEELDGPELIHYILDMNPLLHPVAFTASAAATLASVNKALDEFEKLTKRLLGQKKAARSNARIYLDGKVVLSKGISDREIDGFFKKLRQQAKEAAK